MLPKNTEVAAPQAPAFFSPQVRQATRFFLDLAPPAEQAVAVVCGGYECCDPDYTIRRDDFPYYSIEFVARGKGRLWMGGRETALAAGAVFAYGPGVFHEIASDAAEPLEKYFVDFTGQRAVELLRQYGPTPGASGRVSALSEVQAAFDLLIHNALAGAAFAALLCNPLLEFLLVKIAESLLPSDAAQTPAFATYQRCRQHLQAHGLRLKSLADAARECHVDAAYLSRLFRRYAHQTPHQFLARLKMNWAAQRLQDPGVLVKKVAAELGFDDAFHFSRAFKQVFGLSPRAFRALR